MNADLADEITTCHANSPYGSAQGNALMHAIAQKTAALTPAHQYVPWVVADGQHTEEINDAVTDDLLAYVCKNYQGEKAAACNSVAEKYFYNENIERNVIEKCYDFPAENVYNHYKEKLAPIKKEAEDYFNNGQFDEDKQELENKLEDAKHKIKQRWEHRLDKLQNFFNDEEVDFLF